MIPKAAHIYLKMLLNPLLELATRIVNVPNNRTKLSMKSLERCSTYVSIVISETKNCVKSHIKFSR